MIEMMKMAWPVWAVALVLSACGDDGGGGTAGGTDGGTGGDGSGDGADDESGGADGPDGPETPPDPNGDQCGDDVNGWQTLCLIDAITATTSDMGVILGAPPVGANVSRFLCCEGRPSTETTDQGCNALCQLELCEAAKIAHMNRCDSCGPFDCGFDMSKCLAGGPHNQLVTCLTPLQFPFNYTLDASCQAFNNETRNPDGSFGFLEQPVNDPTSDPPFCDP